MRSQSAAGAGATDYHDVTDRSARSSKATSQDAAEVLVSSRRRSPRRITRAARRDARPTWSSTGIGVWGNNRPVGWAWDITNFVFWIGIGHAGTLISAILFLFRQKWRTSINRSAEAMTIFAVACAGIFPLFHTGASVARLLAVPDPEHRPEHVAELPQSR